jgi:hypothetical protein
MQRTSRHTRWALPAAAVAAVAAVTAGSLISVAQAAPRLPSRTPAQLLAAVAAAATPPPPLTGTVVETASLGLPQLPDAGDVSSLTSLLTGSHTVKVWYGGPRRVRLAAQFRLGETDLIRNGRTAWLWQSRANSVIRYQLPAHGAGAMPGAVPSPTASPLTPQQAAQRVLAAAGPGTRVSVESNASVAGQAAYQLVLAPRDSRSLVGRVVIALDGRHPQVPLRVQVFPRGAAGPAFQVGYTSISYVTPAAANFRFSPPPGAHVRTGTWPARKPAAGAVRSAGMAGGQVMGKDWLAVAVLPASALSGLGGGSAASAAGQAARAAAGSGQGPGGAAVLAALLHSATPVHGTWGSGRLLRTSLVSVLITSNGHVLAGAVTPEVLYADAARLK